jgi:hypothetical protein
MRLNAMHLDAPTFAPLSCGALATPVPAPSLQPFDVERTGPSPSLDDPARGPMPTRAPTRSQCNAGSSQIMAVQCSMSQMASVDADVRRIERPPDDR